MLDYIKGKLVSKQTAGAKGATIVVENNNIGYLINTTNRNISIAGETGDEIKIYTCLIHREDAMLLCGFLNKEDRDIFNILITVSGVGMKVALVLLDEFSGCDLISVVIRGDFKELSRAKGIGPKLAQKIILELKDKLIKTELPRTASSTLPQTPALSDTQAILLSLGYEDKEIEDARGKDIKTIDDISNPEEILRKALTCLSL